MAPIPKDILHGLGTAKSLALGCYGEDIAAYRYLLLSEKAEREQDVSEFREMVVEEQDHRDRLQGLLDRLFPGSKFVLTADEKQVVESGPRNFEIRSRADFEAALRMVINAERLTAKFYDLMEPLIDEPEVRAIFRELADEGIEHAERLCQLARENNITSDA
jgi:rubrerythrin